MWRISFLVNLQACRLRACNLMNSWWTSLQTNSFTGIFQHCFNPPMLCPCIDSNPLHQILKSPLMFWTPVGNPAYIYTCIPTYLPTYLPAYMLHASIQIDRQTDKHIGKEEWKVFEKGWTQEGKIIWKGG